MKKDENYETDRYYYSRFGGVNRGWSNRACRLEKEDGQRRRLRMRLQRL